MTIRRFGLALAIALVTSLVPGVAPASAQDACVEGEGGVQMRMLLEKTIFNVDVLKLTVDLYGSSADRIRAMAGAEPLTGAAQDSVARVAADATCARAELAFVRDVSLGRFLDAIRKSSRAARDAGFIDSETLRFIDRSLPEWYAFLEGRGVRDGDRMSYRIRGDTLNVVYRSGDDELLLDQTDVGAARRRSVLAGYFAPGSDFREGLLRSLSREEATSGRKPSGVVRGDPIGRLRR